MSSLVPSNDQIEKMMEHAFHKAISLILQARILSNETSLQSPDKWFYLTTPVYDNLDEKISTIRTNNQNQLGLDIFIKLKENESELLLEKWILEFNTERRDVRVELSGMEVYEKLSLLIRCLYMCLRILPCYSKIISKYQQSRSRCPYQLDYRLYQHNSNSSSSPSSSLSNFPTSHSPLQTRVNQPSSPLDLFPLQVKTQDGTFSLLLEYDPKTYEKIGEFKKPKQMFEVREKYLELTTDTPSLTPPTPSLTPTPILSPNTPHYLPSSSNDCNKELKSGIKKIELKEENIFPNISELDFPFAFDQASYEPPLSFFSPLPFLPSLPTSSSRLLLSPPPNSFINMSTSQHTLVERYSYDDDENSDFLQQRLIKQTESNPLSQILTYSTNEFPFPENFSSNLQDIENEEQLVDFVGMCHESSDYNPPPDLTLEKLEDDLFKFQNRYLRIQSKLVTLRIQSP